MRSSKLCHFPLGRPRDFGVRSALLALGSDDHCFGAFSIEPKRPLKPVGYTMLMKFLEKFGRTRSDRAARKPVQARAAGAKAVSACLYLPLDPDRFTGRLDPVPLSSAGG